MMRIVSNDQEMVESEPKSCRRNQSRKQANTNRHNPKGLTVHQINGYNPPALLLPTVLVNIIVVVVYFYPRLRIRYPEFILAVIIVVSEARYTTLHSTSSRKLSEGLA